MDKSFNFENKSIAFQPTILSNPIEYLKGVGPLRADLLKKELQIFTFGDLLLHFPFRHIDRTSVQMIGQLHAGMDLVQVKGILLDMEVVGEKRGRRLVAHLRDGSGIIELAWFQGITWVQKNLVVGQPYLAFGKLGFFGQTPNDTSRPGTRSAGQCYGQGSVGAGLSGN